MAEPYQDPDEIMFDEDEEFGDEAYGDDAERDNAIINDRTESDDGSHRISADQWQEYQSAIDIVKQFNSNPVQSLQTIAQQLGFEVRPAGGESQQRDTAVPGPQSAHAEIESLIDDDSMKFLAPVIAKVADRIVEKRLAQEIEPIRQSQTEIAKRNRQQEYLTATSELSKRAPDWQSRERDMLGRLEFIKGALNGGPMVHHQYGNLLEVLYNWASGRDNAVRDVAARFREAPRQRAVSSSGNQANRPNVLQLIAKAPRQDHTRIAFDEAVREVLG